MQLLTVLLTLGVCATGINAQGDFVYALTPTIDSHPPQTDEEVARSQAVGRYPEALEFMRPSLDQGLTPYTVVSGLAGNYTFAASDVLAVLTNRWAEAFMTMYPKVTIRIPGPYAGSLGTLELIDQTRDGVFVSRELKPSDITSFQEKFNYMPFSVPISGGSYRTFGFLDSLAFVVHKNNPIDNLTFAQLDSILSTTNARGGKPIRKWGELGVSGSLANKSIEVYGLDPWNGIEEFVRQRVLSYNGTRGEWRNGNASDTENKDPNVHWDETIFNATRHAYEDPAGISYTGFAYIDRPVKIVALSNNTGEAPVAPSHENIAQGKWPLSRLMYFNTNKDPLKPQDPVLKELTKFVLSKQGQQILLDHGVYLLFNSGQQSASSSILG